MELERYEQIDPQFIKTLRENMGLSLDKFWSAVGCIPSSGFRYEEAKVKMPEAVKRLLFLHYGIGIPTDFESERFRHFIESMRTKSMIGEASRLVDEMREVVSRKHEFDPLVERYIDLD